MRIISQNLMDFPYEQIIVEVDDNRVMCRLCAAPEHRYCLGTYKNSERAVEVFERINKHFMGVPLMEGGATFYNTCSFVMPEG